MRGGSWIHEPPPTSPREVFRDGSTSPLQRNIVLHSAYFAPIGTIRAPLAPPPDTMLAEPSDQMAVASEVFSKGVVGN
jgi:hypothetical protein